MSECLVIQDAQLCSLLNSVVISSEDVCCSVGVSVLSVM